MNRLFILFIGLCALTLSSLGVAAQDDMSQAHADLVTTFIDEAFNKGNMDALQEYIAENYTEHGITQDRDGFQKSIESLRAAAPDIVAVTDPIFANGDWVAFRFIARGTFTEPLGTPDGQTLPPTGKPIEFNVNLVLRVDEEGKIAEAWSGLDTINWLTQLGAIPAPEGASMTLPELSDPFQVGDTGNEAAYQAAVEAFSTSFLNEAKLDTITDLYADHAIHHSPVGDLTVEMRQATRMGFGAAMPDFHVETQAVVAQGDWVAVVYDFTGTFTGTLTMPDGSQVPGNNASVQMTDVNFYHFGPDGKVIESWEKFDSLGLFIQLGVIPAPGG